MDATFIVLVSFVIFGGLAYRLGYRRSITALDKKIANTRQALEDAAQAKEAAIHALDEERRHQVEVLEEIELIAKQGEEQTIHLREQTLREIDKIISNRQQEAENMMKRLHHEAVQTIQEEATAKTLATFEKLVTEKFSKAQQEALNEDAISKITAQLNKAREIPSVKLKRQKAKRTRAR